MKRIIREDAIKDGSGRPGRRLCISIPVSVCTVSYVMNIVLCLSSRDTIMPTCKWIRDSP